MKSIPVFTSLALSCLLASPLRAEAEAEAPEDLAKSIEKHQTGSVKLAGEQDELSADVQELIDEQTSEEVIDLLGQVETIMAEVIGSLDEHDTGGPTIAAETEIIEKIFEAAKKKAQQQSEPKPGEEPGQQPGQQPGDQPGDQPGQGSSGAMLDMMRRMMGESPEGEEPGEPKEGEQASDQGGGGLTGDSDSPNKAVDGSAEGNSGVRTVPKSSGTAGTVLPEEFRGALDAYNRPRPEPEQP